MVNSTLACSFGYCILYRVVHLIYIELDVDTSNLKSPRPKQSQVPSPIFTPPCNSKTWFRPWSTIFPATATRTCPRLIQTAQQNKNTTYMTDRDWKPSSYLGGLTICKDVESVRVTGSLVLCVCFVDRVCPFVLFLLVIVLSVLLRYADSDYSFGIFKLFLSHSMGPKTLISSSKINIKHTNLSSTIRPHTITQITTTYTQ